MLSEVGSLFTAERPLWVVHEVEELPDGTERDIEGTGWLRERVELRERQGQIWLVAMGRPQPTAPPIPAGPEFLLSLVNLVKPPLTWERVDESVTVRDAQAWCTPYGLPTVEAIIDEGRPGVSLGLFQREALTLALLYQVWWALFYKDGAILVRTLPQLCKAWASQRRGATDHWRAMVIRDAELIAQSATVKREELAEAYVQEMLDERRARVQPIFEGDGPTPRLYLTEGSLCDIGYVQVAILRTKPDVEIRQHLKRCQNCQRFFWGHGNRRYCEQPQCDRRIVHRNKMLT